jgi:hypothetical protein
MSPTLVDASEVAFEAGAPIREFPPSRARGTTPGCGGPPLCRPMSATSRGSSGIRAVGHNGMGSLPVTGGTEDLAGVLGSLLVLVGMVSNG